MRRRLAIAAGAICAVLVISAAVLWLMLHRVPSWYAPIEVARSELPAIRNTLPNAYQQIGTAARGREPFWFTLSSTTVTQWIVAREELYPEAADWLPDWIVDPSVVFVNDRAILGARIKYGAWHAIAAIHLRATLEEGDIVIRVQDVTLGTVSVPLSLLDGPLRDLLDDPGLDTETMPDPIAHVVTRLREVGPEVLVTEGVRWRNLFRIRKGARLVRIQDMSARNGTLRILLDPQ